MSYSKPQIGLGYREPLHAWISRQPAEIECLELTAEHFYGPGGLERAEALGRAYPVFVHGLGLSLGTPGPLLEHDVARFAQVAEAAQARWISEHIAFTRSQDVDLGHLNPIAPSRETLRTLVGHARELSERCGGRRVLLENITSHLSVPGEYSEPEFLRRLCEESGCGLLLDVTNLFINSRNHGFDPLEWLHGLDPCSIVQLHIVGYSRDAAGRYQDQHAQPIQTELLELLRQVLAFGSVEAVILERDADFFPLDVLETELVKLIAVRESSGTGGQTARGTQISGT